MTPPPVRCVAILGATATGKSALGIALARRVGGEVISMDSRQIYRGMEIGTAQVPETEREGVPHHLMGFVDPTERWSAGRHADEAARCVREIAGRARVPILVGGTGLYFRALLDGLVDVRIPPDALERMRRRMREVPTPELHARLRRLDPERAASLSPNDRVRITRALELIEWTGRPVTELYAERTRAAGGIVARRFFVTLPRPQLRERIARRTRALFEAGWPDEVRRLLEAGVPPDAPGMASLGYPEIASALRAGRDPRSVLEVVTRRTQQYAKRQETFFRGMPAREPVDLSRAGAVDALLEAAERYVAGSVRGT